MTDTSGYCMILTTCPSREEAHRMASLLVGGNLAACVQVTEITSFYRWKGELNTDPEHLLLIKARKDAYDKIEDTIRAQHGYEVPEIIQVPIDRGFPPYLQWIDEVSGQRV
ncbi:MAG: divalent-cation tolerance protein CutA [Desulfomonilia bacterium]|jgi:periplasmic divalent cation tolerance protein